MKYIFLFTATLFLVFPRAMASPAPGKVCSVEHAIRAEAQLEKLRSWIDAARYYQLNEPCLDGGLSEAFTNFLSSNLAAPGGGSSLWKETSKRRSFRSIVAARMQSEAIPLSDGQAIVRNLRTDCPSDAKTFCRDMRAAIGRSCAACDADK